MMNVMNYLFEGIEYMVCSSEDVQGIGSEGLALLADRRKGVGADKIILVDTKGFYSEFEVFDNMGEHCPAGISEWNVMSAHARKNGLVLDPQKLAHAMGEKAIEESQIMGVAEIHVTDYFCGVLRESGKVKMAV